MYVKNEVKFLHKKKKKIKQYEIVINLYNN